MEKFTSNGSNAELAVYETPFADTAVQKEEPHEHQENFSFSFLNETDSPFKQTFETPEPGTSTSTPSTEAFAELLAELNDPDFETALYNLASEAEDTFSSKISNETAMGENYIPYATQQVRQHLDPLANEAERILDRISEHFSGNNLSDQTEVQVDMLFEQFESDHISLTPAQEQFLGSLIKKAKSVVKTGINLAKKGISAVGNILPVNVILGKLKKLVRPLLDKVLRFAINKLPKNFRPYAQTLAKKLLNLETTGSYSDVNENPTSGDLESVQFELDSNIANLMFSSDTAESEDFVQGYLFSSETLEREFNYETGGLNVPSMEQARSTFINDLKNLQEGESPVPAIEKFLPAAILAAQPIIKMAISVIGRPKVINFLARLLAGLVAKYIPRNIAQPLAAKIVDVGMAAIGFETYEAENTDLAYEAIANTIENTIQNMGTLNEELLNDQEALTGMTLESFESAAVNNFPSSYIKEEVRKTKQTGSWVLMPRKGPRKYYKKFTNVFNVTIDPAAANSVTIFRDIPLSNFLRDKLGLDPSKPIQARVHLYEGIEGTLLSRISRSENVPGLGPSQPYGWVQLHPLTVKAATLLLKEPGLGRDVSPQYTKNRYRTGMGQRFFYLEISGARLKLPRISKSKITKEDQETKPDKVKIAVPKSSDIQGVINLIRSEIRINYFFSEEDAKTIVERLNRNDYLGASISIRYSVRKVLNDLLIRNVGSKVKIIHEAVPEIYLDNVNEEDFAPLAAIGSIALNAGKEVLKKVVEKLVERIAELAYKAIVNYFKARAAEFKQAQAKPDDGVTVKIIWSNIPGMSSIRAVINAVRGKLSVGNITALVIPNIPIPDIRVSAGKNFN